LGHAFAGRLGGPDAVAAALLVAVAVTSSRLGLANPLLVGLLVAAWLAWRRGLLVGRPLGRPLLPPLAFFSLASVVSASASLDPLRSWEAMPRLVVLILVPLSAALVDRVWWPRLVTGLAAVTTLFALWGIVQYMHGANHLENRIQGPMSHYMIYAGWMLLAVLVLLAELLLDPGRRLWLLLPPAVLGTVALFLSYTRNAWVGLAAGLLLLAVVWRRRLLLVYPALALVIWLVLPRPVMQRALSTFDLRQPANYDRLCMWVSGVQMIRDYPLTGVGPTMVEEVYPLYRRDDAPRWRVPHLHNNVLQIGAERGLPALACYFWLLGAFFVSGWRALPNLAGSARAATGASLVAILGITVAGLFEYNFWSAPVQYLTLVILGIAPGMAERKPE
jgi:putative inorganic carbon (HCO3(-)) transporter